MCSKCQILIDSDNNIIYNHITRCKRTKTIKKKRQLFKKTSVACIEKYPICYNCVINNKQINKNLIPKCQINLNSDLKCNKIATGICKKCNNILCCNHNISSNPVIWESYCTNCFICNIKNCECKLDNNTELNKCEACKNFYCDNYFKGIYCIYCIDCDGCGALCMDNDSQNKIIEDHDDILCFDCYTDIIRGRFKIYEYSHKELINDISNVMNAESEE